VFQRQQEFRLFLAQHGHPVSIQLTFKTTFGLQNCPTCQHISEHKSFEFVVAKVGMRNFGSYQYGVVTLRECVEPADCLNALIA